MMNHTGNYTTTMTITLTPMSSASKCLSDPENCATTDSTFLHPFSVGSRPRMIRQISQPTMGTGQSDQLAVQAVINQRWKMQEHHGQAMESNTDLAKLKATATRLRLSTRRSSYLAWLEDHFPKGELVPNSTNNFSEKPHKDETDKRSGMSMIVHDKLDDIGVNDHQANADVSFISECKPRGLDQLTRERTEKIEESLRWIKDQLQMMKDDDQVLARKLLHLYQDIHRVRLSRSCQEHREHLDEIRSDLEESNEFSNVLDLPRTCLLDGPLKHLGVTRLNINARRFSTC
ncbi:unnamed protein product [Lymnaea stagnalis]|uniref:Uncharacterized protein n=1 Tax=Lymnaea stagnalis TaxID=6523 RepID=A0AAV2IG70_LYMST